MVKFLYQEILVLRIIIEDP